MQTTTDEQHAELNTGLDDSNPFKLLYDMQTQVMLHAAEAPEYQEHQEQSQPWAGIIFSLNQQQYVVAIGDVTEILPVPDITPLPGTKFWVKGVANVHGRIVPIVDLPGFLGLPPSRTDSQRIMLVDQKQLVVGLVVDDVHGMVQLPSERFADEESEPEPGRFEDTIDYFVAGRYLREKEYPVFSIDKLISNSDFLMAANE